MLLFSFEAPQNCFSLILTSTMAPAASFRGAEMSKISFLKGARGGERHRHRCSQQQLAAADGGGAGRGGGYHQVWRGSDGTPWHCRADLTYSRTSRYPRYSLSSRSSRNPFQARFAVQPSPDAVSTSAAFMRQSAQSAASPPSASAFRLSFARGVRTRPKLRVVLTAVGHKVGLPVFPHHRSSPFLCSPFLVSPSAHQEVEGLGFAGDQVNVPAGFARNKLIPQKAALPAIPKFLRQVRLAMEAQGEAGGQAQGERGEAARGEARGEDLAEAREKARGGGGEEGRGGEEGIEVVTMEERVKEAEEIARRLDSQRLVRYPSPTPLLSSPFFFSSPFLFSPHSLLCLLSPPSLELWPSSATSLASYFHPRSSPSLSHSLFPLHSLISLSVPSHSLFPLTPSSLSPPLPSRSLPSHSLPSHSLSSCSLPSHSLPSHSLPSHSLPQPTLAVHPSRHTQEILRAAGTNHAAPHHQRDSASVRHPSIRSKRASVCASLLHRRF
ncbi:unnamed protein product [Closterium sp. NIES-54]